MKSRITQKDVAREAGVSHVAVSLALRGHHSIPKRTQSRIRRIAKRLGYVPDPMLAGLASYRLSRRPAAYHANLAWIQDRDDLMGGYVAYYEGARARAGELGYRLEEIRLGEAGHEPAHLNRVLFAKGISGILLLPSVEAGGEFPIDLSRLSAVRFGHSYRKPVVHTVTNAQFKTMFETFRRLSALGCRRIGLVLEKGFNERTRWNYVGGFLAGQQQLPKAQRVEPLTLKDSFLESHGEIVRWVARHRLDCLVANGNAESVADGSFRLPQGLGYADTDLVDNRKVSGMCQNGFQIGASAVTMLVDMMQRGEVGIPEVPRHLYIESSWVAGTTVELLK